MRSETTPRAPGERGEQTKKNTGRLGQNRELERDFRALDDRAKEEKMPEDAGLKVRGMLLVWCAGTSASRGLPRRSRYD